MKKIMIVGRLTKDVREVNGSKGKFLSFSVASDGYDAEKKEKVTIFTEVTLNRYGAGLVPLLVKGTQVTVFGLPGSRTHEDKVYPTLSADMLSLGNAAMYTNVEGDGAEAKTMAAVVGRLGKDAVERSHDDKNFISMSVATEKYNAETKANETVWLDVTVNRYGAGLPAKLTKGTNLALFGLFVEKADEKAPGGVRKTLYVNDLHFFGNKKSDSAPADSGAGAGDADI